MTRPLRRTTIQQMPPPHAKNRFRFCFEMRDAGGNERAELEAWCLADPDFRYELTGETVDPRAWKPERNRDKKDIKSKLGYSRVGLGNV